MRWLIVFLAVAGSILSVPNKGNAADFVVYSVYKALDMGNPGEVPQKDFYVNMGESQGLHEGSKLEVIRKFPTYDLVTEKLYKDVTVPFAKLKVIHVEPNAAIARIDVVSTADKVPVLSPRAVMVGDIVRVAE